MTEQNQEIDPEITKINGMSHLEMARLWRYAEIGHPYFDSGKPYYDVFQERFNKFGGMTSEVSKIIGWND